MVAVSYHVKMLQLGLKAYVIVRDLFVFGLCSSKCYRSI